MSLPYREMLSASRTFLQTANNILGCQLFALVKYSRLDRVVRRFFCDNFRLA